MMKDGPVHLNASQRTRSTEVSDCAMNKETVNLPCRDVTGWQHHLIDSTPYYKAHFLCVSVTKLVHFSAGYIFMITYTATDPHQFIVEPG